MLAVGRRVDLAAEVASQVFAGYEPLVAVLEDLQHLLRGERPLNLASGVVHVPGPISELILAPESEQTHRHTASRCRSFLEVAYHVEYIRVDVVGAPCVE